MAAAGDAAAAYDVCLIWGGQIMEVSDSHLLTALQRWAAARRYRVGALEESSAAEQQLLRRCLQVAVVSGSCDNDIGAAWKTWRLPFVLLNRGAWQQMGLVRAHGWSYRLTQQPCHWSTA